MTTERIVDGIPESDLTLGAEKQRMEYIRGYVSELDGVLSSDDATQHYTCSEADAMHALLELAGDFDLAGRFMASHTNSDEEGDTHYDNLVLHDLD